MRYRITNATWHSNARRIGIALNHSQIEKYAAMQRKEFVKSNVIAR